MKLKTKYKLISKAGFPAWDDESWKPEGENVYVDWCGEYDKEILDLIDLVEMRIWRKAAKLAEAVDPMLASLYEDFADDLIS